MPQNEADFEIEFERAIATYADPGDAGHPQVLAARVEAAIDAHRVRRRWWLGISAAVPAMVCLLFLVLLSMPRHHQAPQRGMEVASTPKPLHPDLALSKAPLADQPQARKMTRVGRRMEPRSLPKLGQFPASTPLTEQEELLLQFIAQTPQSTQQSVARTQRQLNEPLQIAKLVILPLDNQAEQQ
jgi:hypothetical protein